VTGGTKRHFSETSTAFFLQAATETTDPDRAFSLSATDFARVNPNTKTAPIFRTRHDAEIVRGIYERLPVLNNHATRRSAWPVKYFRMLDMTNDAGLFRTRAELEGEGVYPVEGGRLRKGSKEFLPLYAGKTVNQFDHRAASASINVEALHVMASSDLTTDEQHSDPNFAPAPQFYVSKSDLDWQSSLEWAIAFRDIARPTDRRTMIAAAIPKAAAGNKLPLLIPSKDGETDYQKLMPIALANLNAFVFDYVTRAKMQSTSLNWYIVEQLPVVPAEHYSQKFGKRVIGDLVREEVLHLTYVSRDMQPFAEDLNYEGKPFKWDDGDRRHRRARLDAIYFHLYGVTETDADYILDTFPIVRELDEKAFGSYRTKKLILAYMRAFAAGDTTSRMAS